MIRRSIALTAIFLAGATIVASDPGDPPPISSIEFLGAAEIPSSLSYQETLVGGLSAITYNAEENLYYSVSDDPGQRSPARFYTLDLKLDGASLGADSVSLKGVTTLRDAEGRLLKPGSIDLEGIALTSSGGVFISSEGQIQAGTAPFLARFDAEGRLEKKLPLPRGFELGKGADWGPRHNLVFESLGLTPDERYLFTATENALAQDGPESDLDTPSPARILRYDLSTDEPPDQFVYWVDPVTEEPIPADAFRVNGLVDLIALGPNRLLTLERSFSIGVGNEVLLYQVDLESAKAIGSPARIRPRRLRRLRPAKKTLLLDLSETGVELDNLEGLTFGPTLPDGRRLLVIVGDDNFNAGRQVTQILVFAIGEEQLPIPAIQGHSHRSSLVDRWVVGIEGTVTHIDPGEGGGFFIQAEEGDGDAITSDALYVATTEPRSGLQPGRLVRISGRVREESTRGGLPRTVIHASVIEELGDRPLPEATVLNCRDRLPPGTIRAGEPGDLQPESSTLDFFESMEGMRIELVEALVVGPATRYHHFTILPCADRIPGLRTRVGGLLLQPDEIYPRRLRVQLPRTDPIPGLAVGDRFQEALEGVLDYRRGSFQLLTASPLPQISHSRLPSREPVPQEEPGRLTVATYNVENLHPLVPPQKVNRLAEQIAVDLGSPDILALQEIQDDSGPVDDGITSAELTLELLIEAIRAAGGPAYEYRQVDPKDNRDGGSPGGNIRVALLFNPARVQTVDRGPAGPLAETTLLAESDGVHLSASPGRIAPSDPAFRGDDVLGPSRSRKPLVAEFRFGAHPLFVINLHLSSKRGDDPLFGARQPPVRASEIQRTSQTRVVGDFVSRLLARDPGAAVLVLGDLNEHEFRPPMVELERAGLVNLITEVPLGERYTYNYTGLSQVLDHVLVSPHLATQRHRVRVVHLNADRPAVERASDHDPVLVTFHP